MKTYKTVSTLPTMFAALFAMTAVILFTGCCCKTDEVCVIRAVAAEAEEAVTVAEEAVTEVVAEAEEAVAEAEEAVAEAEEEVAE